MRNANRVSDTRKLQCIIVWGDSLANHGGDNIGELPGEPWEGCGGVPSEPWGEHVVDPLHGGKMLPSATSEQNGSFVLCGAWEWDGEPQGREEEGQGLFFMLSKVSFKQVCFYTRNGACNHRLRLHNTTMCRFGHVVQIQFGTEVNSANIPLHM